MAKTTWTITKTIAYLQGVMEDYGDIEVCQDTDDMLLRFPPINPKVLKIDDQDKVVL